jgi:hypothetical protein
VLELNVITFQQPVVLMLQQLAQTKLSFVDQDIMSQHTQRRNVELISVWMTPNHVVLTTFILVEKPTWNALQIKLTEMLILHVMDNVKTMDKNVVLMLPTLVGTRMWFADLDTMPKDTNQFLVLQKDVPTTPHLVVPPSKEHAEIKMLSATLDKPMSLHTPSVKLVKMATLQNVVLIFQKLVTTRTLFVDQDIMLLTTWVSHAMDAWMMMRTNVAHLSKPLVQIKTQNAMAITFIVNLPQLVMVQSAITIRTCVVFMSNKLVQTKMLFADLDIMLTIMRLQHVELIYVWMIKSHAAYLLSRLVKTKTFNAQPFCYDT